MKRFLISSVLIGALVACNGTDRTAQLDDIREATFRYQFVKTASGQQRNAQLYFLSVIDSDKLEVEDPSERFMKRFAGHTARVAKRSEANSSINEGVRDKKTGERGLSFHVGEVRWKSDTEVEVDGGYYEAGLSASGNTYFLKKKRRRWVVERDVMHTISHRGPNKTNEPPLQIYTPKRLDPMFIKYQGMTLAEIGVIRAIRIEPARSKEEPLSITNNKEVFRMIQNAKLRDLGRRSVAGGLSPVFSIEYEEGFSVYADRYIARFEFGDGKRTQFYLNRE